MTPFGLVLSNLRQCPRNFGELFLCSPGPRLSPYSPPPFFGIEVPARQPKLITVVLHFIIKVFIDLFPSEVKELHLQYTTDKTHNQKNPTDQPK